MMECQSSKTKGGSLEPPSSSVKTDSQITIDLNSYEYACVPSLQQFDDAALQERTNHVISTLAAGVGFQSLPFDSLTELTGCDLETNQREAKMLLESKKDIWNNPDLFSLVEEYFDNSKNTLDIFTDLENRLRCTRHNQSFIRLAVKYFEEEVGLPVGTTDEKKFLKTLEELRKFKAANEPFPKEFFQRFESVLWQQKQMCRKLKDRKGKLEKKLKYWKTWGRVLNVLFVATFFSVLIFSVVAAALAAPPAVTALAGAMATPIGSLEKWCNWLWNCYENELKEPKQLIEAILMDPRITITDMGNIRAIVSQLKIKIEPLLHSADVALSENDAVAVKPAIKEMKKNLEAPKEIIESLALRADLCGRGIKMRRKNVLRTIWKGSGTSTNGDSPWEL